MRSLLIGFSLLSAIAAQSPLTAEDREDYLVCVSNEHAGTVSFIGGQNHQMLNTLAVGKRPRGIHASAADQQLYVALSGSPIKGPPKLDAQGNPIFEEEDEEE